MQTLWKALWANAKEAGKELTFNLLADVLRAAGNCLLASKVEAMEAAEKKETDAKNKINVYEDKI